MITPSLLTAAGWKYAGRAWYKGTRTITCSNGGWEIWIDKVNKEIKTMEEINQ
jgi:hypothetical protein